MNTALEKFLKQIIDNQEFRCPICGSARYATDQGNHELTFHCSSAEARFWDFEKGTHEQLIARQHWDQSRRELFLSMEDVLKFVNDNESLPEMNFYSSDAGYK